MVLASPCPSDGLTDSTRSSEQVNVRVCCRVRPLQERERERVEDICLSLERDDGSITHKGSQGANIFVFDKVFNLNVKQQEVYEYAALPIVNSVMDGFNGTVFAYGQTSSGKT